MKGTNNDGAKTFARRGLAEHIFHTLANIFNVLHWAIGITTLPTAATSREERSFVLMWLGLIVRPQARGLTMLL